MIWMVALILMPGCFKRKKEGQGLGALESASSKIKE